MNTIRRYALAGCLAFAIWRAQRHLDLSTRWSRRVTACRDRLFTARAAPVTNARGSL